MRATLLPRPGRKRRASIPQCPAPVRWPVGSPIAFSANPALGDFDDAVILGRYGETLDNLVSFTSVR